MPNMKKELTARELQSMGGKAKAEKLGDKLEAHMRKMRDSRKVKWENMTGEERKKYKKEVVDNSLQANEQDVNI